MTDEQVDGTSPADVADVAEDIQRAISLRRRYAADWNLGDLEEAIRLYRACLHRLSHSAQTKALDVGTTSSGMLAALTLSEGIPVVNDEPLSDSVISHCRLELVAALVDHYGLVSMISVLDEQTKLCHEGLENSPYPHPRHSAYLYRLGTNLCRRYELTGNVPDIEESVSMLRCARRHHQEGYVTLSAILSELAFSLVRQFQHLGSRADITEALALHQQAVQMCSETDPEYHRRLLHLAHGLFNNSAGTGSTHDLHASARVCRTALALCPPGHIDRHKALAGLSTSLWMIYEQSNVLEDLQDAIRLANEALALTGDLQIYGSNLATTLQRRFSRLGNIEDLERAITLYRDTLKATPPTHRFNNYTISNLAFSLRNLYLLGGDLSILEEAIKLQRQGVDMCTPGEPQRSVPINNLAKLLLLRFQKNRDTHDLDEAISLWREALALETAGRRHHSEALCQLAEGLTFSFDNFGNESHLHEAIALHLQLAQDGNPSDHRQGDFLFAAANAFRKRFEWFNNLNDLESAVERYRASLAMRPIGHPERHRSLHFLASALRARFQSSSEPDDSDIDAATAMQEEAIELLPSAHPDRALVLSGLARIYLTQDCPMFSVSAAMDAVSDALADNNSGAQERIGEASDVLEILHEHISIYPARFNPGHKRLLELHTLAIRLLPSIANFGLDIRARLRLLVKAERIATRAAGIALAVEEPTTAIELLEEGRAVFWAQYLRLRTTFEALPKGLSEELTIIANQLEASSNDRATLPGDNAKDWPALEEQAARRRSLSERFDALVLQARAISGFERFLLPASYEILAHAAQGGIIATLIPGEFESSAIIMHSAADGAAVDVLTLAISSKQLLMLSNVLHNANHLHRKRLRSTATSHRSVSRTAPRMGCKQVLRELWGLIALPIIEKLRLPSSSGRERPRIWWCATGVSAFLPLHAAGAFLPHAACCSDYVVSSYTPTIGALMTARQKTVLIDRRTARMLLAGVPHPFEGEPLEDVVKETLVIKATVPSQNFISLPADSDCSVRFDASASVGDVVSHLPDASFLHMACHGTQDCDNALESGFAMRDQLLTVAHLISLKLPHAFLAFLSACETAKGDEKQPDQAVHLAAAMLFVGFRSVVGTMWSMGDVDGPLVAQIVYGHLFKRDITTIHPDDIPYALDEATGQLRARGLHPSRWAPYIHLGL